MIQNELSRETELGKKILFWYRAFCVLMVAANLFVAFIGIFPVIVGMIKNNRDSVELYAAGGFHIVLGIMVAIPYAISFFAPRKPWHWVYGIVLISVPMMSCACLPISIPLLIFWLKPQAKQMFE